MTTIAYRNGVLAADGLGTRGSWLLPGKAQKLFRMKDGGMAAITGDYANGCQYIHCLSHY